MKIALGVRHFRPLGGAEHFVRKLAHYLVGQGHEVSVYAITGTPIDGVRLHLLPRPRWCPRYRRDWATGRLISEALARSDADVTFGEQKIWNANVVRPGGGVEATYWKYHLKRKWKSVWLAERVAALCPKRRRDLRAERRSLLGPDVCSIIVNSDLVRRDMVQHYPSVAARVQVVHNGSDLVCCPDERKQRLRQDTERRFGLPENARLALFIGHDFYRKGLESAILSLAKAQQKAPGQDWHLLVTGRGHIEPYQQVADKAGVGDRLHYMGEMKDAFQAYASADVLLFPSHYDPFANVTAEAICYGVPVITTADNGGCEIIRDGYNGWVVESPMAIEAMADHLVALSNPIQLAAMKANAMESSRRCKLLDTMRSVEKILIDAAEIRSHRAAYVLPTPVRPAIAGAGR